MNLVEAFERMLLRALSPAGPRARLLILTYHRVLPAVDALVPDEPDAALFAAQMDVVGKYCRVLPLPEAARRLGECSLPAGAACLTFDDGYENNLSVALPILEARGMTATIFIAVDAVERGIMWNDLLIEAMRRAGPAKVLEHFGLAKVDAEQDAATVLRVLEHLKYHPLERRWEQALACYRAHAPGALPRCMLRREQLREVAERGHEVGAHTLTHPILSTLTPEQARAEIVGSYRRVADAAGRAPKSFAYPNGRPDRDYGPAHVAMVRDAGFDLAVSTRWGCATKRSDRFQLPRCAPWNLLSRSYPLRLAKTYLREAD